MKGKNCNIVILMLAACLFNLTGSFAQDLINPILSVKYIKLTDNSKKIQITLQAKEDRKMVQIENGEINVYALFDTSKIQLANLATNYKGEASFTITKDKKLPTDKSGNTKIVADYAGNAKYSKASSDLMVKDVFLDVELSKDSSKTITAFVYEINNKGDKVFIKDVDIVFNVKRLFCLYPIGTAKTDPTGVSTAVFPSDIPGDTTGKLDIVVRIQDNDSYATVEKIQSARWGKPIIIEHKTKRGLGDTDAPLWMVYTLLVLLTGVWVHFIYVLILILRIDKIGKRLLRADAADISDNR